MARFIGYAIGGLLGGALLLVWFIMRLTGSVALLCGFGLLLFAAMAHGSGRSWTAQHALWEALWFLVLGGLVLCLPAVLTDGTRRR